MPTFYWFYFVSHVRFVLSNIVRFLTGIFIIFILWQTIKYAKILTYALLRKRIQKCAIHTRNQHMFTIHIYLRGVPLVCYVLWQKIKIPFFVSFVSIQEKKKNAATALPLNMSDRTLTGRKVKKCRLFRFFFLLNCFSFELERWKKIILSKNQYIKSPWRSIYLLLSDVKQ